MATAQSTAAYKQVADGLRKLILCGELAPGERLPTERELCQQFSASRITIRRALQILADEILIQRRHGSGTFVSPTPSRRIPLLATDFSGSVAAHAPELRRRLEAWHWQKAPDDVAGMLQSPLGSRVLFARRIDVLEDVPVAYDEVYLSEQVADRLDKQDLGQLRFLERWEKVQQIRIDYLTQSIEAVAAEPAQARYLGGVVGGPLLKEIDTMFFASGTACGLFISYYRNDLFRLVSTIRLQVPSKAELP
ncbi:MAG: GntR family transcriptional regulator [Pirellulales bacterium]|nr:GntR family transcriptional regulator [Pirellulales bacterium]